MYDSNARQWYTSFQVEQRKDNKESYTITGKPKSIVRTATKCMTHAETCTTVNKLNRVS
jgi:hypothetical protein